MKTLSFILSFIYILYIAIPFNAYPILNGADLQNVALIPLGYNNCIKNYPRACCFQGQATLTTKYDDQSIKSFTLKGNQIGQNCPNELVFLPISDNLNQIIMNKFYIRTDYDQLTSFLFYTGSRSQEIQGQTKYDYQFSLHLHSQPRASNVFQDFMLKNTDLPIEEQQSQSFSDIICSYFVLFLLAIQMAI
ncbi:transmembrane protein, putative (macronuclear) [Tetrahymena thermophila SB210]|uniref:Transmembrane protein, putative n=1 Tax=Tetrahymena thermophila (strain SB210) TaxID=312017 RepID=Q22LM7_TETTS|nr:transmembrane protein, putative [Tetrahymena thermophila SB210]EAR86239.1 transmembrane protein, putative [Tetrahymena thermophila SB210]|eukprot:XP_976834.1 transmembrane protein, putative [Tetrahymena thermophila SB210]